MAKNLRLLSVFVLLILLLCVLPAGQSYLTTFFGPVEFVRGTGKPFIETVEFSAVGFQGPFVLHLRNGDSNEKHRVSSAKIWLNGELLFRTSDFSQRVEGYDIEVDLQPQNKLEVEIRSKKGTKLKIWIEGFPTSVKLEAVLDHDNSATLLISPETGGIIETFGWDGTKYSLLIPPNALLTEKEITLTPIIDIIGLPYGLLSTAAVQIEPDGLFLMSPATLTIELLSQVPYNFLGFLFQNNGEGFHLYPIKIDGNKFSFNLMHCTGAGGFIADCEIIIAWDVNTWLTQEDRAQQRMAILEAWVQNCESYDVEELMKAIMEIHYDWFFDSNGVGHLVNQAYNDPAGFLNRAINQLNSWYFSCVRSDFVLDYPGGLAPDWVPFTQPINCGHPDGILCSNLDEAREAAVAKLFETFKKAVTYANDRCISGGQSQDEEALNLIKKACMLEIEWDFLYDQYFDWEELAELKTCGIWSLEIDPSSKKINHDDTLQLKAVPKDKQRNTLSEREVEWRSLDEDVATVDDYGLVTAVEEGTARIIAEYYFDSLCSYNDTAEITVSPVVSVEIYPETAMISIGGTKTLKAKVYDIDGNELQGYQVDWTIPPQEVISVESIGEDNLTIVGVSPGTVTITATCEGESATATITVEAAGAVEDIEIDWPCCYYLAKGEKVPINVTFKDAEGRPIPPICGNVEYYSSDESILQINLISGYGGPENCSAVWEFEIEALAEGEAGITILYDNGVGRNFGEQWSYEVAIYDVTRGIWGVWYENVYGVWDRLTWGYYFKFDAAGYLYFVYSDGSHCPWLGRDPEDPPEHYDGTYTVEYNGGVPTGITIRIKYINRLYRQINESPPGDEAPDWHEWTFVGNFSELYGDCPLCFESNEIRGTHNYEGWRAVTEPHPTIPDWFTNVWQYVNYEGTFKAVWFTPEMSAQNTEPWLQDMSDRSDSQATIAKTKILEDGRKITKNSPKSVDKVDR